MVRLRKREPERDEADLRAVAALSVLRERFGGGRAESDDPRLQRLIEEERADRQEVADG